MDKDDVTLDLDVEADGIIRKKDIFAYVSENTSLNKKLAREAVEATLAFLQQVLADEKDVIIPPLGKINTKRVKVGLPDEKLVHRIKLRPIKTPEV